MTAVVWPSYIPGESARSKWDSSLLQAVMAAQTWDPVGAHRFEHVGGFDQLADGEGAVVVLAAGIHRDHTARLNADLAALPWVLLVLTADEQSLFPILSVRHPNLRLWVMTPRPNRRYPKGTRFLGHGFPPHAPPILATRDPEAGRAFDWFFAGQVTHVRREQMCDHLAAVPNGKLIETEGFTQGLEPPDYLTALASAKVAPAPSGPATPDSFRLYEALEAGCVPLADGVCPAYDHAGYWDLVAPGHPFPVVDDWADAPRLVASAVGDWSRTANRCGAWWEAHKRAMAYWLVDDLAALGASAPEPVALRDQITVLISSSPIPSHPSTAMIEQTVESIRERLPACEILLGVDGIRPAQEHYRAAYDEYTRRLLWLARHRWTNVLPMLHEQHAHQSGMAKTALPLVRTPYVLYVEADLPLCGDIPFEGFVDVLADGTVDLIRLTLNTDLEPLHRHLFLDPEPVEHHGVPLTRTVQWSQQPHLASTVYYRSVLDNFDDRPQYIEPRMHSICAGLWHDHGEQAWFRNRLAIYTPPGNMCRVIHLDGRAGDAVFPEDC